MSIRGWPDSGSEGVDLRPMPRSSTPNLRSIHGYGAALRPWAILLLAGIALVTSCTGRHGKGTGDHASDLAQATHRHALAELQIQLGHSMSPGGALELDGGRILSWSSDGTLRMWEGGSGLQLATLEGHQDTVLGAIELPEGRILSWSSDRTLRTWDARTGAADVVFEGHSDSVYDALFLQDGRLLSWSADGTLRIWNAATGQQSLVLEGHRWHVLGATELSAGRILSWSSDHTLRIWDSGTGQSTAVMRGHEESVRGAAVIDDDRVLSWSLDGSLRIWDVATGRELQRLEGHEKKVWGGAVLADGRLLSWSADHTLRLWDATTGRKLLVLDGHRDGVDGALELGEGRILSWSGDQTLRIWDGTTGENVRVIWAHSAGVEGAMVLPGGSLLSWSYDGAVRRWDPATGQCLAEMKGHTDAVTGAIPLSGDRALSWSWDRSLRTWDRTTGRELAVMKGVAPSVRSTVEIEAGRMLSWGRDSALRLWDGRTGRILALLRGHTDRVRGAVRVDGGRILSWSKDPTLRLWDDATGRPLGVLEGHTRAIASVIILVDGRILSLSEDRTLRIWDGEDGEEVASLVGHTRLPTGAIALDEGRLLSWSRDHTLRIWDSSDGTSLAVLTEHEHDVVGATALDDGRILSWDGDPTQFSERSTLRIWDGSTGRQLVVLEGHRDTILGARELEDGRILSWGADRSLRLWDGATGRELNLTRIPEEFNFHSRTLEDGRLVSSSRRGAIRIWDGSGTGDFVELHGAAEPVLGFSSLDGDSLLTRHSSGTLRVWDAAHGAPLARMDGHLGRVWGAQLVDDRHLLSWSDDGTHRIWDLESGALLATTLTNAGGESAVVTPDGRFDAPPGFSGLHFVVDHQEVIQLDQLRDRFYEHDLLAKVLGRSDEAFRSIEGLDEVELWPDVGLGEIRAGETRLTIDLTNRGGGLGKVRVLLNGAEVISDVRGTRGNRIDPDSERATLRVDLAGHPKLRPGVENEVEVVAFNGDGSIASRGAVVRFVAPGEASTERPDLHAVVVGVSDYDGDAIDLGYAARDAEDFAAALALAARPEELFEDVHIHLLTTEPGATPPTRENLEHVFAELQNTKPSDVVVAFLAGHGVQSPTTEDSYLFLTQEAANTTGLSDPALQERWTISSLELHEWLTRVPAGKQVLILDTCAAEAAADSLIRERKLSGSQIRAIDRLNRATGMHILMGSAADAVSYEASRYGQGLLTYALLEGMRGAALADGGYVDVMTLFGHAQKRVGDLARSIGGVQEPRIAVPKGQTFDIGQLTDEHRRQIPLKQPRPMISRPSFLNEDELEDDLDLSDLLAEALTEHRPPRRRTGGLRGRQGRGRRVPALGAVRRGRRFDDGPTQAQAGRGDSDRRGLHGHEGWTGGSRRSPGRRDRRGVPRELSPRRTHLTYTGQPNPLVLPGAGNTGGFGRLLEPGLPRRGRDRAFGRGTPYPRVEANGDAVVLSPRSTPARQPRPPRTPTSLRRTAGSPVRVPNRIACPVSSAGIGSHRLGPTGKSVPSTSANRAQPRLLDPDRAFMDSPRGLYERPGF